MQPVGTWMDECEIRRIIENWVVFRDAGRFDRLLALWHEHGRMVTLWAQGEAAEFVKRSEEGFRAGMDVLHLLGGSTVDIRDDRAIAQTRVVITQRGAIDGVECDAACIGRFYDFFARRQGRWGIVLRQPIYERDRLDPVDPASRLELDESLLRTFPPAYRHLGYLQTKLGMQVKMDLPQRKGAEVDALYERGRQWLEGVRTDPW